MARGGARPGAGRDFSFLFIEVGQACERASYSAMEKRALDDFYKTPKGQAIKKAQDSIRSARAKHKSPHHAPPPPATLSPGAVKKLDEIGRLQTILVFKRKVDRAAIIKQVAACYNLSPRNVDLYWKQYRRLQKEIKEEQK